MPTVQPSKPVEFPCIKCRAAMNPTELDAVHVDHTFSSYARDVSTRWLDSSIPARPVNPLCIPAERKNYDPSPKPNLNIQKSFLP
jgi:hypothetical protein